MTFKSRISIVTFVYVALVLALPAILLFIYKVDILHIIPLVICITAAEVVTFGKRYTIDENMLYVGYMFYRGEGYDLRKLESIKAKHIMRWIPAVSVKYIQLDFGCGEPLIVSPAAQDYFIEEILRINPNVNVE